MKLGSDLQNLSFLSQGSLDKALPQLDRLLKLKFCKFCKSDPIYKSDPI